MVSKQSEFSALYGVLTVPFSKIYGSCSLPKLLYVVSVSCNHLENNANGRQVLFIHKCKTPATA